MIIENFKLNKTKGGSDFSYPNKAEDAITAAVCYWYDLLADGGTNGLDPAYDKLINSTKVEIKISSSKGFFIEISKGNGDPSGLTLSEADIYMTVNPGEADRQEYMKVRVYNKMLLEHWVEHMLENHPEKLKTYPANKLGPGSSGFMLEYRAVEDLYILGFEYEKDSDGNIIFDTHKIHLPSFAKNNIRKFIP